MSALRERLASGTVAKLNLGVDLVLMWAALSIATLVGHPEKTDPSLPIPLGFAVLASIVWLVTSTALRHYDPWDKRDALDDAALVSVLVMAVTTMLELGRALLPEGVALPAVGPFLLFFWAPVLIVRLFVVRSVLVAPVPSDQVLIVGTGPLGRLTGKDLMQHKLPRNVLGYLRFPEDALNTDPAGLVLGSAMDLENCLRLHPVSEVYIAGNPTRNGEAMQAVIKTCEKFGVPFALPAYGFRFDRARAVAGKAIADGYLHYLSVDFKPYQHAVKRMFDIAASALALWALVPLFLLVAAAVKLSSKGPVFFKQKRVGLHGRTFHMLKFRSMVQNAEELKARLEAVNEQTGPVFKMTRDPRVTRVGRFIRKYSIDELPQLINVLRGDMSIVGPRPPVPSEVAKYEGWQRRRLSVRPGLTCIWQVSGRSQISFEQWMYLDMQYIDHWRLADDFNLILKTVPVVLTGRGAS